MAGWKLYCGGNWRSDLDWAAFENYFSGSD